MKEQIDRWYLLFGDSRFLYWKEYVDGLLTQIDRLKYRSDVGDVISELEKFAIDIISRGCYASK